MGLVPASLVVHWFTVVAVRCGLVKMRGKLEVKQGPAIAAARQARMHRNQITARVTTPRLDKAIAGIGLAYQPDKI